MNTRAERTTRTIRRGEREGRRRRERRERRGRMKSFQTSPVLYWERYSKGGNLGINGSMGVF